MRLFLVAVRLLVLSLLLASQLIADAHAENSAASAKCIDIPDGLSSDDLIALCTSVIETEKDLPAARLAQALHARGVGYKRKKDFDNATADFKKALEVLPAGSDENFRQILMMQRDSSIDDKKAAAEAAAANTNNWPMFLAFVAGVCGVWAISFRTRIGALAFGTTGRISRRDYWLALLSVFAIAAVQWLAVVAAKRLGVPLGPIAGPVFLYGWAAAMLLAATAVSIKRLHDRNRSAWNVVTPIVALSGAFLAAKLAGLLVDTDPDANYRKAAFTIIAASWFGGLTPVGPAIITVLLIDAVRAKAGGTALGAGGGQIILMLGYLLALATSLWYLGEVGVRRGTVGANSYGSDPVSAASVGQASKLTARMSPRARRYAAAAAALVALGTGLYAFAPWRLLSQGPDQANIEAFADEHCRHAREEMSKDLGLSPNRKSAAGIAIRACTIVIGQDTRAAIRADSYLTRGRAYDVLDQKEKAVADFKEAVKLKPTGGAACELANKGVAGYQCSVGGGGSGVAFPPMGFN